MHISLLKELLLLITQLLEMLMQIILIKIVFKNCAPFTYGLSEIHNTQIDNAKDIDIIMPMYNLIEYSGNYSKTFGSLRQYFKDIPTVDNNNGIANFNEANASDIYLILKQK